MPMKQNGGSMTKAKKKHRDLPIYFTPIYNIIIQNWFLDPIERLLAILIASQPNGICELSREILKKYCRCGPYHLERAIKRLEFMNIIRVERGGWKQRNPPVREPNHYIFEFDPYLWRIPKEIQKKIKNESENMGKTPREFTFEGFPNQTGMEIVFRSAVPRYAEGRRARNKGRRTLDTAEGSKSLAASELKTMWHKKMETITSSETSFAAIAAEYYAHMEDIDLARNTSDHGFSNHQVTFFERLHYIFTERQRKLKTDEELRIHEKICNWVNQGWSNNDISSVLKHEAKQFE
jgi:hypothetical protein